MMTTLRETANFTLLRNRKGFVLRIKHANHFPRQVSVFQRDVDYLQGLKQDASFDGAAVWDYGVGVQSNK